VWTDGRGKHQMVGRSDDEYTPPPGLFVPKIVSAIACPPCTPGMNASMIAGARSFKPSIEIAPPFTCDHMLVSRTARSNNMGEGGRRWAKEGEGGRRNAKEGGGGRRRAEEGGETLLV
jgi:hypothetical protein